jgi:hypothetical protein
LALVHPTNNKESSEFKNWMNENYKECFCKKRFIGTNSVSHYWEIRGTEIGLPIILKLIWL